jgi:hypothetical protein
MVHEAGALPVVLIALSMSMLKILATESPRVTSRGRLFWRSEGYQRMRLVDDV